MRRTRKKRKREEDHESSSLWEVLQTEKNRDSKCPLWHWAAPTDAETTAMNHDSLLKKIVSQNHAESTPSEVFATHSISYRSSGAWIRIKASWRGGNDFTGSGDYPQAGAPPQTHLWGGRGWPMSTPRPEEDDKVHLVENIKHGDEDRPWTGGGK